MKTTLALAALAGLSVSALANSAGGIGVGGSPPSGPFTVVNTPGAPPQIDIGDASNPIPIFPDPAAPHWIKTIEIDIANGGLLQGQIFTLCEWLTILPGNFPGDITDWHEHIVFDGTFGGFEWEAGTIDVFDATGGSSTLPGLNPMAMGPDFWFFFDPIRPAELPLTIKITKQFFWTGPDIVPGSGPPIIRLEIHEYFTPAPSSLALLGLGGLVAARRRR